MYYRLEKIFITQTMNHKDLIEPKFLVEFVNEDVNIQFVALSIENDDYKDDGTPDEARPFIRPLNVECHKPDC